MSTDPLTPPRVSGNVVDGKVVCTCGRNVGLVHVDGVEFFCRHCHVNVVVNIRQAKLEKLARIAELIAKL